MANTKVTSNVIADDAITTAKIADDAVGSDQLASGLTLGGTTTFGSELLIPEKLTHTGDTDTHFKFAGANDIRIVAGNVEHIAFDGTIVINQSAADMDVRIESTGNQNMLYVDSGNDVIGVGLNNPHDYYSKNLVVMADGDNTGGITIAAPATDDTVYLAFADGTSGAAAYAGYVGYVHNTDDLILGAGGGTRLTLDSSSAGFSAGATFSGSVTIADDSDPTLLIRTATADQANSGKISFREASGGTTGVDLRYDGNTNKFIIDTSDVSNALTITRTTGKVGIGLGANAANALLHVGDGTDVTVGNATNPAIQIGSDTGYRLGMYTDAEGGYIENKNGDDGIRFRVKTVGEAMRIDGGSGNVGIGVAPSSWGSAYRTLDIGTSGAIWTSAAGTSLTAMSDNTYFDGSVYRAKGTQTGAMYYQNAGGHYWNTAPSVSAGAEQTFTSVMQIGADKVAEVYGDFKVLSGDIQMGNGRGINFTATANSSGTMASETMTDYEHGTWNPGLIAGTTNPTGGSVLAPDGEYTRIGNRVWVTFYVGRSWTNSPSGTIYLSGLPYAPSGSRVGYHPVTSYNLTYGDDGTPWLSTDVDGGTNAALYTSRSGSSWIPLTWQNHAASTSALYLSGSLNYLV